MSLNTQMVLPGHLGVDVVVGKFRGLPGVVNVGAAQRYRPEHWALSVSTKSGTATIDLFLASWAKEDHAEIYDGESVFLTGPMEPLTTELFSQIAQAEGGFMRKHEQANWEAFATA